MKIFNPLEKVIATHTILLGLVVLSLLPEESGIDSGSSSIGWVLYILLIMFVVSLCVHSLVQYADFKRNQFRLRSRFYDWKQDEEAQWDFLTEREFSDKFNKEFGSTIWKWESEDDPFRDDNEPNDK